MKRFLLTTLLLCMLMLAIATPADARINVYVNESHLRFDVPPARISGRVMVPLRSVFEALGAEVKYEAAAKRIKAAKGGKTVVLFVGDRDAYIDGKKQVLDIPASLVRGRTLVPLRFVSEALGAKVKWVGRTDSVYISTSGTTPGGSAITRLSISPTGRIKPGNYLTVKARGAAGASAHFNVAGLVNNLSMQEVSPGVYRGKYQVPLSPRFYSKRVEVVLKKAGKTHTRLSSNTFGNSARKSTWIKSVSPKPGETVSNRMKHITVNLGHLDDDATVYKNRVKMTINGADVSSRLKVSRNRIQFIPTQKMQRRKYTVKVSGRDNKGGKFSKNWTFYYPRSNYAGIEASAKTGSGFKTGEKITVNANAKSGLNGYFSIGNRVRRIPLKEVKPGQYQGSYRIRSSDKFSNQPVQVYFRYPDGRTRSKNVGRISTANTGKSIGLRINSPRNNSTISQTFTIKGHTASYANVKITAIRANGNRESHFTVKADRQGNFVFRYKIPNPVTNRYYYFDIKAIKNGSSSKTESLRLRYSSTHGGRTVITGVKPTPGAVTTNRRPYIYIYLKNHGGANIDKSRITLKVNHRNVTHHSSVSDGRIRYRPGSSLPIGRNVIDIHGANSMGRTFSKTWNFTVKTGSPPPPTPTFKGNHNATSKALKAGQDFVVTLSAPPGLNNVRADVGGHYKNIQMKEIRKGYYVGRHKVRKNDNFTNAPVKVSFKYKGKSNIITLPGRANILGDKGSSSITKPTVRITSPKNGAKTSRTFELKGSAPPKSYVVVNVSPQKSGVGPYTLSTRADSGGNFRLKCNLKPYQSGLKYRISSQAKRGIFPIKGNTITVTAK